MAQDRPLQPRCTQRTGPLNPMLEGQCSVAPLSLQCDAAEIDGWWERKASLTELERFWVSWHALAQALNPLVRVSASARAH